MNQNEFTVRPYGLKSPQFKKKDTFFLVHRTVMQNILLHKIGSGHVIKICDTQHSEKKTATQNSVTKYITLE